MQPQFKLSDFPQDKLPEFKKELEALLEKFSAHLSAEPKPIKNTIKNPDTGEIVEIWSQTIGFVVYLKTPIQAKDITPNEPAA